MIIVLAIAAAVAWGVADFCGGASRRRTPVFVVLAISQLLGLLLIVPVLAIHGAPLPRNPRILLACVSGLGVTLELRLVYFAISRGDAFITAPVGALGATLAVLAGLLGGDPLSVTIAIGLGCALIGGAASAWSSHGNVASGRNSALETAGICAGAATGVAVMLVSFHAAGRVDPYWATALVDLSTAVAATIAALAGARRALRHRLPGRRQIAGLSVVAASGVAGDLAYAAASRLGALSIVSAISSLYPLSTVALGIAIQGQRARRLQTAGIALALIGAALLGAATHS